MTTAVFSVVTPVAHADIFSFVAGIFTGKTSSSTETEGTVPKSQTMALLKAAINEDPNPNKNTPEPVIVDGTSLLSEIGPAGTIVDAQKSEEIFDNSQIQTYTVRSGDTLPQIAKVFNVSVKTIQIANDLTTTVIKEGQRLLILPISGIQHSVRSGETISGLAKAYKLDISDIAQYNHLEPDAKLAIGDIIFIPSDEVPATPSTTKTPAKIAPSKIVPGSYFIEPLARFVKTQGIHGHNGVDLAAPVGTKIMAAASGEVILSRLGGWNGGYGSYIVIQHPNGLQTLYAHASALYVTEGQHVVQGQAIAAVGLTGKTTGPHVHVEVRGGVNPF